MKLLGTTFTSARKSCAGGVDQQLVDDLFLYTFK